MKCMAQTGTHSTGHATTPNRTPQEVQPPHTLNRKSRLSGIHRDALLVATLALELDHSVNQRKWGPVLANGHIRPRMDLGANLTHQNVASTHDLPVMTLDAASL